MNTTATDTPTRPAGDDAVAAEMNAAVRKNVRLTLWSFAILFGVLLALGFFFDKQLESVSNFVAANLGVPGMAVLVAANDVIVSPIPSDGVLVFISKSTSLAPWGWWLALLMGLVSAFGGLISWTLGRYLGNTRLPRIVFRKSWDEMKTKYEAWFARRGQLVVALGALTPIPFSLTCWLGGVFRMCLPAFLAVTILRVPRFMAAYAFIVYGEKLGVWLRSLL